MHRLLTVCAALLALASSASSALAADGELDPSFDGDGRLTSNLSDRNDVASDVAIDAQGRIVVASNGFSGQATIALVSRYLPDGSLDKSFGGDGVVGIEWGAAGNEANGVAIDTQGRIVVGGSMKAGAFSDFAVARLLPSGAPDTSFDGDGKQTFDAEALDFGEDLAVDSQDRVLLAGETTVAGETNATLLRFNSQGKPDLTFGAGGLVLSDFDEEAFSEGVLVDPQGRIVVAGGVKTAGNRQFAAARFDDEGLPDASFNGDGLATIDLGPQPDEKAVDLAIDPQGRILLGGRAGVSAEIVAHVVRLDPNGNPDPGFDGDGRMTIGMSEPLLPSRVLVDAAGRIVLAGGVLGVGGGSDAMLARLQPNGGLDPAFGSGGILRENYGAAGGGGSALAIDASGRYLLAGTVTNVGTDAALGLARFLPNSLQMPGVVVEERMSCAGQTATIEGTGGRDVLNGTSKRDVIVALGGNDQIRALGGNDLVCAGAGRDFVRAGAGNDRVLGGAGPDRILGGAGKDTLLGQGGGDLLSGGPARDKLRGGAGRDDQRQ